MCLSEKKNLPVDLNLISQYVQDEQIARDFAIYYDLFKKYKNDYQVDRILFGIPSEQVRQRAMKASFDERISFLGLLMDGITDTVKETMEMQNALFVFGDCLKKIKAVTRAMEPEIPIALLAPSTFKKVATKTALTASTSGGINTL